MARRGPLVGLEALVAGVEVEGLGHDLGLQQDVHGFVPIGSRLKLWKIFGNKCYIRPSFSR